MILARLDPFPVIKNDMPTSAARVMRLDSIYKYGDSGDPVSSPVTINPD